MADVSRICAACGGNAPIEAQYCPVCGHDTQAGLPAKQPGNLPMVVGKAALPMLVTVGTLVTRIVWKLLRDRALPTAGGSLRVDQPLAPSTPLQAPARQPSTARRSVRIRTTWAVGDANGVQRQGYTEHQIDFDD